MVDKSCSCALAQIPVRGGFGKSANFKAVAYCHVFAAGARVIFFREVYFVPRFDANEPELGIFVCIFCEPYDLSFSM